MQWSDQSVCATFETNIFVRGLHRYMDSTTYRPIAISSFARERGLVPSFAFYEYFRQREKRRKKRGSSEGGGGIRGSRVDDRVIPRRRASPRRAAGGNRNGIGKPFGASLIDDLVPRKRGPPIKGRISTHRWDRDAWAASKLAFNFNFQRIPSGTELNSVVSLALARQRLYYVAWLKWVYPRRRRIWRRGARRRARRCSCPSRRPRRAE